MNARNWTLVLVMVASAAAVAEETVVSAAPRVDAPRFRLGTGVWAGVGGYPFRGLGLLGPSLQLGVQLNDRWAVVALGHAATTIYTNVYAASLLGEYTFADRFSIGTGLMVGGATNNVLLSSALSSYSSIVVGVPVRLAVVFGPEPRGLFRNRFYVALDGWIGAQVKGSSSGVLRLEGVVDSPVPMGGGLSIGYQLM